MVAGKMTSPEQLQPTKTNNSRDELYHSFNQLSLRNGSLPPSSPTQSPSQSPFRKPDRRSSRHDTPSSSPLAQRPAAPRRIPSSSSLRDERRGSAPSLQKRPSVGSLRTSQNLNNTSSPRPSLSRRSSTQFLSSPGSGMRPKSPLVPPEMASPPTPPTASSIAAEHFAKELSLHQSTELHSRTVVIIQDACYGHRFSRPRTSKAGLELIVERPERLHASILGLATAYIRMGNRHGESVFAPHPDLDLGLLPIPPFQIRKTSRAMPLSSPAVTHIHGTKWMDELKNMCDAAQSRLALNGKELVRPNSSGKDDSSTAPKLHEGDLYLSPESLNAFEGALGGVCEAIDSVFGSASTRRAFVCIRPPGHHCAASYPSGFCWLNNVHVGIAYAAMTHGLTHAAILDFDLHHGDGSQAIAWEQNRKASTAHRNSALHKKTALGYFSLHDINSYPCEGGDEAKVRNASVCIDNAHGQSMWNVHLEPWKTTQEFWQLYNTKYSVLLEKARAFLRSHSQQLANNPNSPPPKAAIFLSAGFDASEWEGAGMQRHKVNVPTDFYARFTADVVRLSQEEGLGVDGRIISVLEGGYSDRALTSGVLSHLSGLSDTRSNAHEGPDYQGSRLAAEMFNRLGLADENKENVPVDSTEEPVSFDTEWWSLPILEELETLARPPPPVSSRKSQKGPPTFFAPTQASSAKVVTPPRERKSLQPHQINPDGELSLPEVDWATAAFEMSKILIPTDRQTFSCQHADLKAETSRARREASLAANAHDHSRPGDRMQLRERKPKMPPLPNQRPGSRRTSSISTRRTTIASVNDLPDPTTPEHPSRLEDVQIADSRASRRLSVASTLASTANATAGNPDQPKARGSSSRPSSRAQRTNSRAGFSASTGHPETLEAKKTRTSARGRPAATPVRSSPRKPQLTSRASSYDKTGLTTRQEPPPKGSPSPNDENNPDQDIGNLAAGIKKLSIKLKVPSPEENAIREAKAGAERKTSTPRSPKKPSSAGKASKPSSTKSSRKVSRVGSGCQPSAQSSGYTSTPDHASPTPEPQSNNTVHSPDPSMIPLPETSDFEIKHEFAPTDQMHDIGVDENHESTQASTTDFKDRGAIPSPPLTPNSTQEPINPQITVKSPPASAPASAPAPQQLPVFTSTSVIPFASRQD